MNKLVIKKGSIVTCPDISCGKDLYRFKVDKYVGDTLIASEFEPIGGIRQPKSGDQSICEHCGAIYTKSYDGGLHVSHMHIEKKWVKTC